MGKGKRDLMILVLGTLVSGCYDYTGTTTTNNSKPKQSQSATDKKFQETVVNDLAKLKNDMQQLKAQLGSGNGQNGQNGAGCAPGSKMGAGCGHAGGSVRKGSPMNGGGAMAAAKKGGSGSTKRAEGGDNGPFQPDPNGYYVCQGSSEGKGYRCEAKSPMTDPDRPETALDKQQAAGREAYIQRMGKSFECATEEECEYRFLGWANNPYFY